MKSFQRSFALPVEVRTLVNGLRCGCGLRYRTRSKISYVLFIFQLRSQRLLALSIATGALFPFTVNEKPEKRPFELILLLVLYQEWRANRKLRKIWHTVRQKVLKN